METNVKKYDFNIKMDFKGEMKKLRVSGMKRNPFLLLIFLW